MNFDDENEENFAPKKGLKIGQSKSFQPSKKQSEENFSKSVDYVESKKKENQSDLNSLSNSLIEIMKDKTLKNNKNPLAKANEKQVINDIISFAASLDSDENEPINSGTSAITTLILALSLLQRDRINSLEYKISILEEKLKEPK